MTYNFKNAGPREIFVALEEAIDRDDAAARRAAFDALKDADPAARDKALNNLEESLIKHADRAGERAYNVLVQEESLQAQPSQVSALREYQAGIKKFFRTFTDLHLAADGLAEISHAKNGAVQPFTKAFVAGYVNLSEADKFAPEHVARAAAQAHRAVDRMAFAAEEAALKTAEKQAADYKAEAQKQLKEIAEKRKQKFNATKTKGGPTVC
jgi:hypothetical protein